MGRNRPVALRSLCLENGDWDVLINHLCASSLLMFFVATLLISAHKTKDIPYRKRSSVYTQLAKHKYGSSITDHFYLPDLEKKYNDNPDTYSYNKHSLCCINIVDNVAQWHTQTAVSLNTNVNSLGTSIHRICVKIITILEQMISLHLAAKNFVWIILLKPHRVTYNQTDQN